MTSREISDGVQEVLMDRLGLDPEEVTLDAKLVADLGANDPVDIPDLRFYLENRFQLSRGSLVRVLPDFEGLAPPALKGVTVATLCSSIARAIQSGEMQQYEMA